MGGPSGLWGPRVPLFHTQINTRNPRAERSRQMGPVIGSVPSAHIQNWAPPRRGARARSEIFILILMLRGYTPGWRGLALLPSRRLQVHFMLPPAIAARFGGTPAWRGLTLLCDLPSCRLGVTLPPVIAVCLGCTPAWRGLTPLMRLQFAS